MKKVLLIIAAILMMGNAFSQDRNRLLPPSVIQKIQDIERQAHQRPVPIVLNTDKSPVTPKVLKARELSSILLPKNIPSTCPVELAIRKEYHLTFPLNTSLKQPSCSMQEKYNKQISKKFWFGCYVFDGENKNIKLKLE